MWLYLRYFVAVLFALAALWVGRTIYRGLRDKEVHGRKEIHRREKSPFGYWITIVFQCATLIFIVYNIFVMLSQ